MADDLIQDAAAADSSTTSVTSTDTGSQSGGTSADQQPPFHLHPRFQELIADRNTLRDQNQQLTRAVQQLQREMQSFQQRQQQGAPLTADQEREYREAGEALERVAQYNPKFRSLLAMSQAMPQMLAGYQNVQQLQAAQATGLLRSGRGEITSAAQAAGLPVDQDTVDHYEELVAGVIRRMPNGEARFRSGDLSVVTEAWDRIAKGLFAQLRRGETASVAAAKAKVGALPPGPRGTASGGEAPPKLVPGKEREFTRDLHAKALAALSQNLRE